MSIPSIPYTHILKILSLHRHMSIPLGPSRPDNATVSIVYSSQTLYSDLAVHIAADLTTNSFESTTHAYAMYILYKLSMYLCIIEQCLSFITPTLIGLDFF